MSASYQARVTALEHEAAYAGRFHVVYAGQTPPHRDDVDDGDVIILLPLPEQLEHEDPVELDPDDALPGYVPPHRRRRIL